MWLHNELIAQKCHFWKHFHLASVVILMTMSFASAAIKYPSLKDQLVAKDSNTLLSPEFLTYLKGCTEESPPSIQLCSLYYDMVYNVYDIGASKGAEAKTAILEASKLLDSNSEIVNQFCDLFVNETQSALDKQPFSTINGFNSILWIQKKHVCELHCLFVDNSQEIKVTPVCKYISGGLRWISKQKKNFAPTVGTPVAVKPKPVESTGTKPNGNTSDKQNDQTSKTANTNEKSIDNTNTNANANTNVNANSNASVIQSTSAKTSTNDNQTLHKDKVSTKSSSVSKKVDISIPAPPEPQKNVPIVTPILNKPSSASSPVKEENKASKPSEVVEDNGDKYPSGPVNPVPNVASPANTPNEDESAYDQKELENEPKGNDENIDTEDGDFDDDHDIQNELKSNSNNVQKTPFSADVPGFREDKESSFFPYFMFLMFIVVSFYVAYHNKSKILALLIEGRRSRSYSSRGGSRRKQHSAEYRKLDSNLEEAIQSDGGHVLSTQIIY